MKSILAVITILVVTGCTGAGVHSSGGIKRAELTKTTSVETEKKRGTQLK